MTRLRTTLAAGAALILTLAGASAVLAAEQTLLNVSYDPTRELYKAINPLFIKEWNAKNPDNQISIDQSHGGSGKQARAVIDGLQADVLTLALEGDIDQVAKAGLLDTKWRDRLDNGSSPYTSTIVFLVRKGNPKGLKDWDDLVKEGVEVITPNPKTSGGAQWNYLAAWAFADGKYGHDEEKNKEFLKKLYGNVPVLDTAARGSTTTFVQRKLGDVLLAWENEAFLAIQELGPDEFDIVVPPLSIKAEPKVAVVDKVVDQKGSRKAAEAYLDFLYTPEAQKLIAKNYYRAYKPEFADPEDAKRFPDVKLVTIDDPLFGGWTKVREKHFADGALFDQIYQPKSTN
jgi:sulfate/thiosulfate transport system substrate-binding protein